MRDSEYFLVFGRSREADERLAVFKQLVDENLYKHDFLEDLWREYENLRFVLPGESLYAAKNTIFNILFSATQSSDSKFALLRDLINSVYDLSETNNQIARNILDVYFQNLTGLRSANAGQLAKFKNILLEESQLLDNLLRFYPQFYLDRFFGMKGLLEQEWLKLIPEGVEKNEEKQSILSNKIDLLNRLKDFFLSDKIGLNEARQILFRLFREAEDLQLPVESEAAVSELYAKRLKKFGLFFRFLNSPEYVQTALHGATRQEQFKQYIAAQSAQVDINELRREIMKSSRQ